MNELVVIVEGETEQTFVRDQLAAYLALQGTSAWAVLPGRNRKRGGVKKWEVARQDIARTLKEPRCCTTMMDYYAMPSDWPGREEAAGMPWRKRAPHVEAMMAEDVAKFMGPNFNSQRFIPYVQLHEFEALAFADVAHLAAVVSPLSHSSPERLREKFAEIVEKAGHPEAINDGYETCPSRRIARIVSAYRKRVHGPIVTGRIGLEALRDRCDHFASWLARLDAIGS